MALRDQIIAAGKREQVKFLVVSSDVIYPDGKMKQQIGFKAGARDGTSTEWDEKGEKRAEATYVNNKINGKATRWLPDGRTIVQEYQDGKLLSLQTPYLRVGGTGPAGGGSGATEVALRNTMCRDMADRISKLFRKWTPDFDNENKTGD